VLETLYPVTKEKTGGGGDKHRVFFGKKKNKSPPGHPNRRRCETTIYFQRKGRGRGTNIGNLSNKKPCFFQEYYLFPPRVIKDLSRKGKKFFSNSLSLKGKKGGEDFLLAK